MNQKLVLDFFNEKGEKVNELSADPALPEQVVAALQFLKLGQEVLISVTTVEVQSSANPT